MPEKRDLLPLWRQCIREVFETAEKNNSDYVDIIALELQKMGKPKFPEERFDVMPSICNAMRSVKAHGDEVIRDTKSHNSSTYTIRYKLPGFSSIQKEDIVINTFHVNQEGSVTTDKSENYLLRLFIIFVDRIRKLTNKMKKNDELDHAYTINDIQRYFVYDIGRIEETRT